MQHALVPMAGIFSSGRFSVLTVFTLDESLTGNLCDFDNVIVSV